MLFLEVELRVAKAKIRNVIRFNSPVRRVSPLKVVTIIRRLERERERPQMLL